MRTLIYNGSVEAGYVVHQATGMSFSITKGAEVEVPDDLAADLQAQAPHEWTEKIERKETT